MQASVGLQILS